MCELVKTITGVMGGMYFAKKIITISFEVHSFFFKNFVDLDITR